MPRACLLLLLVGCGLAPPPADDHAHGAGPHGGTVFDLGRWHAELAIDHGKAEATVYLLSGNLRRAVPVDAESLTLTLEDPPAAVELRAASSEADPPGKASRFVGTHPALATVREFRGTIRGRVEGKAVSGTFAE